MMKKILDTGADISVNGVTKPEDGETFLQHFKRLPQTDQSVYSKLKELIKNYL